MSSFNGIGTVYIGCSAIRGDGTYITTKWLSLVIPIIPLASYRILSLSQKNSFFPIFHTTTKFTAQSVPLYWLHVLQVYAIYLAVIVFGCGVDLLTTNNSGQVALPYIIASFLASIFSVFIVKITRHIRKSGSLTNIIIMIGITTFSLLLSGGISKDPEKSLHTMYVFWIAYAIFSIFRGEKKDTKKDSRAKHRKTTRQT